MEADKSAEEVIEEAMDVIENVGSLPLLESSCTADAKQLDLKLLKDTSLEEAHIIVVDPEKEMEREGEDGKDYVVPILDKHGNKIIPGDEEHVRTALQRRFSSLSEGFDTTKAVDLTDTAEAAHIKEYYENEFGVKDRKTGKIVIPSLNEEGIAALTEQRGWEFRKGIAPDALDEHLSKHPYPESIHFHCAPDKFLSHISKHFPVEQLAMKIAAASSNAVKYEYQLMNDAYVDTIVRTPPYLSLFADLKLPKWMHASSILRIVAMASDAYLSKFPFDRSCDLTTVPPPESVALESSDDPLMINSLSSSLAAITFTQYAESSCEEDVGLGFGSYTAGFPSAVYTYDLSPKQKQILATWIPDLIEVVSPTGDFGRSLPSCEWTCEDSLKMFMYHWFEKSAQAAFLLQKQLQLGLESRGEACSFAGEKIRNWFLCITKKRAEEIPLFQFFRRYLIATYLKKVYDHDVQNESIGTPESTIGEAFFPIVEDFLLACSKHSKLVSCAYAAADERGFHIAGISSCVYTEIEQFLVQCNIDTKPPEEFAIHEDLEADDVYTAYIESLLNHPDLCRSGCITRAYGRGIKRYLQSLVCSDDTDPLSSSEDKPPVIVYVPSYETILSRLMNSYPDAIYKRDMSQPTMESFEAFHVEWAYHNRVSQLDELELDLKNYLMDLVSLRFPKAFNGVADGTIRPSVLRSKILKKPDFLKSVLSFYYQYLLCRVSIESLFLQLISARWVSWKTRNSTGYCPSANPEDDVCDMTKIEPRKVKMHLLLRRSAMLTKLRSISMDYLITKGVSSEVYSDLIDFESKGYPEYDLEKEALLCIGENLAFPEREVMADFLMWILALSTPHLRPSDEAVSKYFAEALQRQPGVSPADDLTFPRLFTAKEQALLFERADMQRVNRSLYEKLGHPMFKKRATPDGGDDGCDDDSDKGEFATIYCDEKESAPEKLDADEREELIVEEEEGEEYEEERKPETEDGFVPKPLHPYCLRKNKTAKKHKVGS